MLSFALICYVINSENSQIAICFVLPIRQFPWFSLHSFRLHVMSSFRFVVITLAVVLQHPIGASLMNGKHSYTHQFAKWSNFTTWFYIQTSCSQEWSFSWATWYLLISVAIFTRHHCCYVCTNNLFSRYRFTKFSLILGLWE